jgi:hypothetical protein
MCERCNAGHPHPTSSAVLGGQIRRELRPAGKGPRVQLWELASDLHCSLIGTCLSTADLAAILRKTGHNVDVRTPAYLLHGIVVQACRQRSVLTKRLQKVLDSRYAASLKTLAPLAKDNLALSRFWEASRDSGQIAGAYWAILTHAETSDEVCVMVFGEVHMLAHDLSRTHRTHHRDIAERDSYIVEMEQRHQRRERSLEAKISEQNASICDMETKLRELAAKPAESKNGPDGRVELRCKKLEQALNKRERSLISAREQLRLQREQASAHQNMITDLRGRLAEVQAMALRAGGAAAQSAPERSLDLQGRTVLYLGGRKSIVDRLKAIVASHDGALIHHDGGLQEMPQRIDELVSQADIVCCAIDCISYDACLRAKRCCYLQGKTFMPLRNSSQSCFQRMLSELGVNQ